MGGGFQLQHGSPCPHAASARLPEDIPGQPGCSGGRGLSTPGKGFAGDGAGNATPYRPRSAVAVGVMGALEGGGAGTWCQSPARGDKDPRGWSRQG